MGKKSHRKRNDKATRDCLKDINYIPDELVGEILVEAARLQAEANKSYSLADLKQIGSEAGISPHFVERAIRKIEEKQGRKQQRQRKLQKQIKKQVKKGISVGIPLVIPAIAVSSLFLFRSQLQPVVSGFISRFDSDPKVMLQDDFRRAVLGKTKQDVIQAVGRPDSTSDLGEILGNNVSYWDYDNQTLDAASGKFSSATVRFENNVVEDIRFSAY
ncbi:MAG: hypothetical protein RIE73_35555 [Coleofasciculus sp. C1-SOL-03]|jgi:hypothetical protein|uniref:hypothetical protein n=1 Tax=Coleofasciculus sp. C1-SOL-03 TaxID=3069522 RepID=UPI00330105BA